LSAQGGPKNTKTGIADPCGSTELLYSWRVYPGGRGHGVMTNLAFAMAIVFH